MEEAFTPRITPGTEHYLTDMEFVAAGRILEGFWHGSEISVWRNGVIPLWKGVVKHIESSDGTRVNVHVDASTRVVFDTNQGVVVWTLKQCAQAYLDQFLWVGSPWLGDNDSTVPSPAI